VNTNPVAETDPATRPSPPPDNGPARRARSAGTPPPSRPPHRPDPRPVPPAQPGTAAPLWTTPPVPIPAPRARNARKHHMINRTEQDLVKHLVERWCKASTGTRHSLCRVGL